MFHRKGLGVWEAVAVRQFVCFPVCLSVCVFSCSCVFLCVFSSLFFFLFVCFPVCVLVCFPVCVSVWTTRLRAATPGDEAGYMGNICRLYAIIIANLGIIIIANINTTFIINIISSRPPRNVSGAILPYDRWCQRQWSHCSLQVHVDCFTVVFHLSCFFSVFI